MTSKITLIRAHFLIIFTGLLLTGCFHGGKRFNTRDPLSQNIIRSIKASNSSLKTFKGIGSVKLHTKNQPASFRLAWAGESPDKLRLIVLVSGRPIETFAANGENIFLKSHTGAHRFIKKKTTNANLKRIISIPIKTKEIISLLAGKIPLKKYHYSSLRESPDNNGYILELARRWSGVVERIFLNHKKETTGFEMVKRGNSVYRVSLNKIRTINEYAIPFEILIKTADSACRIRYSNYFTNTVLNQKTFNLSGS